MQTVIGNILFAAKCGLLKGEGQAHANVVSTTGAATLGSSATECATENAAENISKVAEVAKSAKTTAAVATACGGIERGMTELVIFCLLLGVGENGIGLVDLFEVLLCLGVARMKVRVVFFGLLAVGPLDGIGIGALIEAI